MSSPSSDVPGPDVEFRLVGELGRVTLSRPSALNALTLPMILAIDCQLRKWEVDDRVKTVWIEGAGGRAFCAGGDIISVHESLTSTPPDHAAAERLWRCQHELDVLLADYRKPVVSALDGIVLGGGVGLGCHVKHRLVTETTRVGMPEASLGLVPDVGALHILSRSPGRIGDHIALTGQMFGPEFAVAAGLADVVVPTDSLDDIARDLSRGARPDDVLRASSTPIHEISAGPGIAPSDKDIEEMSWCYDSDDATTIVERLKELASPWSVTAAQRILGSAPLAIQTLLHVMRSPVVADLGATFVQDLRRNVNFSHRRDLVEGIRSSVVDRHSRPCWSPAALDEVSLEDIEACIAPFNGPDLDIDRVRNRP